ncbi:glycosyltransferase family protein [Mangrovivirga cuniculi]|uniref:Glycosyltransferase family 1 protein n=1 Tax=Mangrovivirga cuniculi TaxID=2715131 RepID=A0A4D7JVL5_9BACT|nr:glycosyltransferase [Mangrovivirga cuniculi]QCK16216.1 glycosyltransferase family 1 protein [Mangrovivirga cuniculi]
MKIFYITSPRFDYMQDLLYSGLCKVYGTSNIRVSPINKSYILPVRDYPKNLGYQKNNIFRSLIPRFSIKEADLVIVASAKPETLREYQQVIDEIPAKTKVIFIDGGDRIDIGGDFYRRGVGQLYDKLTEIRPFDFIFKREYLPEHQALTNVFPLPFCFNFDVLKGVDLEKDYKYDVSFWAVESAPIRTRALELLNDKYDCRENGTIKNQQFHKYQRKGDYYLEEIASCKIVLNFRGNGWDTMRFWETPALNTFMISQEPEINIPNSFTHGENIIYCKPDLSDLTYLIDYYLENEKERERIAKNGYEHIKKYHTDVQRAKYVINTVTKNQHVRNNKHFSLINSIT